MPDFDQAQSPRLGQRTPVEATFVRMFAGSEIPEAAWAGQIIWRTDRKVLQVYNGTAWEDVLGGIGNMLTFVGPSIPTSLHIGDVWYDSDDHYKLYISNAIGATTIAAGQWELAQDSYTAQTTANTAVSNAATAQTTANSKIKTFIQGSIPTSISAGDIWYDSSNNMRPYRAAAAGVSTIAGGAWVLVQDGTIALAQTTANGKNAVYYQTSAPTGGTYAVNDIWFDTDDDFAISTWNGSTWVLLQFGTTAISDNGITTANLAAGSVTTETLDVGAVTAEKLEALLILTTAIQLNNTMLLDGVSGLTITHPDGRQTYMRADGSGNQFVGQAILDSVYINDSLTLLGLANTISGKVTLTQGVGNPTTKVGVTASGWDQVSNWGDPTFTTRGMFDSGSNWLMTLSLFGGDVRIYDKTTGAGAVVFSVPANFIPQGGVVKISTDYYVLGTDYNRSGNWYVFKYNSSFTKTAEFLLKDTGGTTIPDTHYCALGIDGTGNLLIARRSVTGNFTINVYTTAGVPSAAAGTYPAWANAVPTSIVQSTVDTATVRYVVGSVAHGIRVFNTSTAARVTSEEWTSANGSEVRGLNISGGNWYGHDGKNFYKYTNNIGTWDFAHAWLDDQVGQTGYPTLAETMVGPLRTTAPTKRAKWTMSLPSAPPDDLTADGANTARLYAAPTGNTLVRQFTLPEGTLSKEFATLLSSGTAPAGANGFASRTGAIGDIVTTGLNGASQPTFEVTGAGAGRAGTEAWNNDGTDANDTGWLTLSSSVSGFGIKYRWAKGRISVWIDGSFTSTSGTDHTISTTALAAAYRPTGAAVRTGGYFAGFPGSIWVFTDGTIHALQQTGVNKTSVAGMITYPTG